MTSYGAVAAALCRLSSWSMFGLHASYLKTDLRESDFKAHIKLKTISLGPILRLGGDKGYITFLVKGSKGWYKGKQECNEKTLQSDHNQWSVLAGLATGTKIAISHSSGLAISPSFELNYIKFFKEKFQEKGAELDQFVQARKPAYLSPRVQLQLSQKVLFDNSSFSPAVHVGWIGYVPLNKEGYTIQCNDEWITDPPLDQISNQLILGGELNFTYCEYFSTQARYDVNLGERATLHKALIHFNWSW